MTTKTEQDLMNGPASQHPALRQAVATVINSTTLEVLAGDIKRQLIGEILDAGSSAFAIADVLIAASVEQDYADELARKIADAVLEAALNL